MNPGSQTQVFRFSSNPLYPPNISPSRSERFVTAPELRYNYQYFQPWQPITFIIIPQRLVSKTPPVVVWRSHPWRSAEVPGLALLVRGLGRKNSSIKRAAMGRLPNSSKSWEPLLSSCNANSNSRLLLQSLVSTLEPEEARALVALVISGEDQDPS